MKKSISCICILMFCSISSFSSNYENDFSTCLTDSMNGKERKELAKWIFLSMSAHEFIKPLSKATDEDRDNSNKFAGELTTRLLTLDCKEQAKAALKEGGPIALQNAFRLVGEVAMQELMNDPDVTKSLAAYEKYLDESKFSEAFK